MKKVPNFWNFKERSILRNNLLFIVEVRICPCDRRKEAFFKMMMTWYMRILCWRPQRKHQELHNIFKIRAKSQKLNKKQRKKMWESLGKIVKLGAIPIKIKMKISMMQITWGFKLDLFQWKMETFQYLLEIVRFSEIQKLI